MSDLPQITSTLPPRKRAKTQEEKEQRRIERILRNRRAAHASREKKRKHVEFLESSVHKLENNIKAHKSKESRLLKLSDKLLETIKKLGGEIPADLDVSVLNEDPIPEIELIQPICMDGCEDEKFTRCSTPEGAVDSNSLDLKKTSSKSSVKAESNESIAHESHNGHPADDMASLPGSPLSTPVVKHETISPFKNLTTSPGYSGNTLDITCNDYASTASDSFSGESRSSPVSSIDDSDVGRVDEYLSNLTNPMFLPSSDFESNITVKSEFPNYFNVSSGNNLLGEAFDDDDVLHGSRLHNPAAVFL